MTTALPAYGRKYANATAAKLDWHKGNDFLESASRRAFNRTDFPGDVVIRYGNQLEKVTSYSAADKRKLDKVIAEEKAANLAKRLASALDFNGWMAQLDKAVVAKSGLSYQDLPDIDFYALYDAGETPNVGAETVLEEAGFY